MRTVLYNCGPIVTFDSDKPLIGQEMSNDKWILSSGKAIVVNANKIEDIQDSGEALNDYESHSTNSEEVQLIDVNGKKYGFEWTVEIVSENGEFKDCWMTVGVSRPMPLSQAS